ncbi:MAG: ATP synthase F1 subunit gamma [Actinobacteria bacterium]|nr:ATP synthase F1 subunit gamma [Actinomycetota bacterium]
MASQRDIKRRITSVQNTKKITKAMEMVAAARLRRAQQRIESTRPYALHMMEFIAGLARYIEVDPERFPLLKRHAEVRRVAVVALTADRGLCGAFNANIVRRAQERLREYRAAGVDVDLIVVGKKGAGTFRFHRCDVAAAYTGITDRPRFLDAQTLVGEVLGPNRVAELYTSGAVDRVLVIFNHFVSPMEQRVTEQIILPLQDEVVQTYTPSDAAPHMDFLFEPQAEAILNDLLPSYVEMTVYRALLESTASEHGARMTAMRNASESAGEMIDELTLAMNRARQASITQEILEVVAGADALS